MPAETLIHVQSGVAPFPSLKKGGAIPENVVISFPSIMGTPNGFGGGGERMCVERLLEGRLGSATVLEASYREWRPVTGKEYDVYNEGSDIIHKTNASPDYIPPEIAEFVEHYMRPLVDNGSNITLFGNSMGGVMIELVRRGLVQSYKKDGRSDSDIAKALQTVGGVAVASVMNANVSQGPGFSMVYYAGTGDNVAKGFNPDFDDLVKGHNAPITIRPFPHNPHSLLVTTQTNPQINTGHGITSFIEKGADASVPSGATILAQNVLHNSVNHPPKTPKNVWELCQCPKDQRITVDKSVIGEQSALKDAIFANQHRLGINTGRGR